MENNISVQEALDKEFYSIYKEDGVKMIKFHGYIYDAGNFENGAHVYNSVEICFGDVELSEFLGDSFDLGVFEDSLKEYMGYLTEDEAYTYINNYWGESIIDAEQVHGPKKMKLSNVTMNTPCGDYIDI